MDEYDRLLAVNVGQFFVAIQAALAATSAPVANHHPRQRVDEGPRSGGNQRLLAHQGRGVRWIVAQARANSGPRAITVNTVQRGRWHDRNPDKADFADAVRVRRPRSATKPTPRHADARGIPGAGRDTVRTERDLERRRRLCPLRIPLCRPNLRGRSRLHNAQGSRRFIAEYWRVAYGTTDPAE